MDRDACLLAATLLHGRAARDTGVTTVPVCDATGADSRQQQLRRQRSSGAGDSEDMEAIVRAVKSLLVMQRSADSQ
jgi:hypothetical protein